MYTLSDEADDDHYRDFVQTSAFLLGKEGAAGFGKDLSAFRRALLTISDGVDLSESVRLKSRIERRLRRVMARTERLSVTRDRSGMLEERPSAGLRLGAQDLRSFMLTDELARKLGSGDVLEYWKSSPYLMNFMEGYKLKQEVRAAIGERADPRDHCPAAVGRWRRDFSPLRRSGPMNALIRGMRASAV